MEGIIGVDIAKAELVFFLNGKCFTVKNKANAIKKWFDKHSVEANNSLVAFEPTGGYERLLIDYMEDSSIPYRMIHANHIRAFAKSKGVLAKTDNIDAEMIADFAYTMKLSPKSAVHAYPKLKNLLERRDQLVDIRVQENNRLDTVSDEAILKSLKNHIKHIDSEIRALEDSMKELINSNKGLKETIDLYQSIPGIGLLTAIRLVVDLPELETHDDKKLAALVGVAPMNKDSGSNRGKRHIKGGRAKLRSNLYLAALSGIRHNHVLASHYKRLKNKGKPGKVALIAVVRKLIMIIRSVSQRKSPWVLDF